jgi:hypothetical protein
MQKPGHDPARDIPYKGSARQQHSRIVGHNKMQAERGDTVKQRSMQRCQQVTGKIGGNGPAEESDSRSGDEVYPRVLRLGKPPGKNGEGNENRGDQLRRRGRP